MTLTQTNLRGVPYQVDLVDGQVIFEDKSGFWGTHCRFAYEWKGVGWYLVGAEDWVGKVYVPHLVAAYEFVEKHFHKEWNDGTATVSWRK